MKQRAVFVLFTITICISLYGQNRWVNNYLEGEDPFGESIIEHYDGGYLLAGRYGPNYPSYNWLIKTDINGEILWKKVFGAENTSLVLSADIGFNSDGDIYLVGGTYLYNDDSDPLIIKLNACGEKQWCRVFVEDGLNYSNALVITPDGGVVILLMYMSTIPRTDRICLAKFDIEGSLQWKHCYNSPDSSISNQDAWNLTLAPDGGFLITAMCGYRDPDPPHISKPKPYYIMTNSVGTFIWEKVVYIDESDKGGEAWSTVLSPDSNYFYSSISHYYLSTPYGNTPALLKMDLYGNVVDIYDLAPIGDYGKMIMAKFVTDTTIMGSAVWGSSGSPKAVIIDTVGNIIHQANLLDNDWMAYTEVTFDNKLLFFTNINDDNGNFDTYLFKLNQQLESDTVYNQWFNYDSLCTGQIVSDTIVQDGCGLIVGMGEIYASGNKNENKMLIYPNPAANIFKLKSKMFEVNGVSIEIFDIFGQKIKTIKTSNAQTEVEVNVKGWRKGLYLIRMQKNGGVIAVGKVIVQ